MSFRKFLALAALMLFPALAHAQSCTPSGSWVNGVFYDGHALCAADLNNNNSRLNSNTAASLASYLSLSGGTMTGRLKLPASITGGAYLNLPQGTAPTSPINGDVWITSSGVFAQVAGSTTQLSSASGAVTSFNTRSGAVTLTSADVTTALTFTPLNKAGDTATGKITFFTPTTSFASITLPHGSAPTSPVNGDMWTTTSALFVRINGVTQQLATSAGAVSSFNTRTGAVTLSSSDVTTALTYTPLDAAGTVTATGKETFFTSTTGAASINLPQGAVPTSPANGDLWTTSSGVFARIAGATVTLAQPSGGTVSSFNTRTGAVTLTSGDVTTALTYTPANKAGDTITGTLTMSGAGAVLAAGTTVLAPLKFTSGTNQTSAAAGSVEWDGTSMYLTQTTGPTRKTVAYIDSTLSGNTTGSAAKWTTARNLTLSGNVTGTNTIDGSGDVTITTAIGSSVVTGTMLVSGTVANSNLANMAANTIKGNNTGSSAAPGDLTASQVASLLTGTTSGTLAAGNDSRFVGPSQNSQSTAYTLVLGDGGGQVYHPSADTTARTWTVPANASVAFQVGAKVELINDCSAGAITLNITTDTLVFFPTGTTGSRTIAACGAATLTKIGSTRWIITGVGVSYLDYGRIPDYVAKPANDNTFVGDLRAFG